MLPTRIGSQRISRKTAAVTHRAELRLETWYALYTRHQHEKNAEQILGNKGFQTFLPLYRTTHQWKDRKKELWLPLFPCYVFLNGGLQRSTEILKTPGVLGFVTNGGRPAVVPSDEIHAVRQLASSGNVEPHPFLKTGDKVRVKAGSLAGVEGILVRKKNEARLVISVEMLGKSVSTEIDVSAVERIERVA